jgi:hypothetical protein
MGSALNIRHFISIANVYQVDYLSLNLGSQDDSVTHRFGMLASPVNLISLANLLTNVKG